MKIVHAKNNLGGIWCNGRRDPDLDDMCNQINEVTCKHCLQAIIDMDNEEWKSLINLAHLRVTELSRNVLTKYDKLAMMLSE